MNDEQFEASWLAADMAELETLNPEVYHDNWVPCGIEEEMDFWMNVYAEELNYG